ncbi:cobalamin binding intrinsic factor-like [Heterodontus francisci]|uniref:cobalamin binding intrinsic factor-like n=1 Tax=Heterodontus francisci TaxID=7792 RepID=UPI00355B140B
MFSADWNLGPHCSMNVTQCLNQNRPRQKPWAHPSPTGPSSLISDELIPDISLVSLSSLLNDVITFGALQSRGIVEKSKKFGDSVERQRNRVVFSGRYETKMATLAMLFLILVLSTHGCRGCDFAGQNSPDVRQIVKELNDSLSQDVNPSVVLALRLGNYQLEKEILTKLKRDVVNNVAQLSSGTLGLYILALISFSEDTLNLSITDKGSASSTNLGQQLSAKLGQEFKSIENQKQPLTTYYQIGLALLGLCKQSYKIRKSDVNTFTQAVMNDQLVNGQAFQVDTGAVAVLALTCLQQGHYQPFASIWQALMKLILQIFNAKTAPGTIGNLYSTGLAMQALIANVHIIPFEVWSCPKCQEVLQAAVRNDKFIIPELASQILPPMMSRTYLDADQVSCPCLKETCPGPTMETANPGPITVNYTVTSQLKSHHYKHSILLTVSEGSSLLHVMKEASKRNSTYFEFTWEDTSLGPFITSIGGVKASANDHSYWQFLNGTVPIPVGVASYKPSNDEHVFAKFSKY